MLVCVHACTHTLAVANEYLECENPYSIAKQATRGFFLMVIVHLPGPSGPAEREEVD